VTCNVCAKCGYNDNGTGDFAHVCKPLPRFNKPDTITLSITEYEQLKKDAERYRWLRGWAGGKRLDVFKKSATKLQLDNAIDQAISEDKHNG
jgi:hypothetical protein